MHDAIDVSFFIINYCETELKKPITNGKLQRILYYIQGLSLVLLDKPMFINEIVAWSYGPVVPDSYYWFTSFLSNPLTLDCCESKIINSNDLDKFNKDEESLIKQVVNQLIDIDFFVLSEKTRNEYPWQLNYIKGENMEILKWDLKKYFSSICEK